MFRAYGTAPTEASPGDFYTWNSYGNKGKVVVVAKLDKLSGGR